MYEYKFLESETLASAEQLAKLSLEGWRLQLILQWDRKFVYHLIKNKLDTVIVELEYYTLKANAPVATHQLEKLGESRWKLQEVIQWYDSFYYYMVREKNSN